MSATLREVADAPRLRRRELAERQAAMLVTPDSSSKPVPKPKPAPIAPKPLVSAVSVPKPTVVRDASPHSPGSKEYWGPKVWKLLHIYASLSDRNDIVMLWRNAIKITGTILPCVHCRTHFNEYFSTHTILPHARLPKTPGDEVRATIIRDLWVFHNHVNARLKKPKMEYDDLMKQYPGRNRAVDLESARTLFDALVTAWTPMVHTHIHPSNFTLWKKHMNALHAFLKCGPSRD